MPRLQSCARTKPTSYRIEDKAMTLTTCAVTCALHDQLGQPEVGAIVRAQLDRFEIDGGYVAPEITEGKTDAQGEVVLDLWPNARGSTESSYKITIIHTSGHRLQTTATVPEVATANLHEISLLPSYPGKSEGQLILDAAVAAGAQAVSEANAAEAARIAAETARAGSEDARDIAHTARTNAEAARDAAQLAQTASETAEANAQTAQGLAESAQTAAGLAQTGAEAAQTNAETAQGLASAAQLAAEAAETSATTAAANAGASKAASQLSEDAAIAAQVASEAAQSASEFAQSASEAAATSAQTAQGLAEAAEASATTQAGIATTAAGDAGASATAAANSASTAASEATAAATSAAASATAKTGAEAAQAAALISAADAEASVEGLVGTIGTLSAVLGQVARAQPDLISDVEQALADVEATAESLQNDFSAIFGAAITALTWTGQIAGQVNGGQVALRGGTLADPALRIGTVGVYSSAANTLSIAIAGSEIARFTASGLTVYGTVTEA